MGSARTRPPRALTKARHAQHCVTEGPNTSAVPTLPFCCTGEFRAGKYEGHGTETLANGAVYEGDFKAGVREGQGTYTTPSGAVYEGQFKAGLKEGEGSYTTAAGAAYLGEWRAGSRRGAGRTSTRTGRCMKASGEAGRRRGAARQSDLGVVVSTRPMEAAVDRDRNLDRDWNAPVCSVPCKLARK